MSETVAPVVLNRAERRALAYRGRTGTGRSIAARVGNAPIVVAGPHRPSHASTGLAWLRAERERACYPEG